MMTPIREKVVVAKVAVIQDMLAVATTLPLEDLEELLAWLRAHPEMVDTSL